MRCKTCNTKFKQLYMGHYYCSTECKHNAPKQIVFTKKTKYIKVVRDYKSICQEQINRLIKVIDHDQACISCGAFNAFDAGHYHSVGSNPQLRYNLFNIYAQCRDCNSNKGGNPVGMRLGIIGRFGVDYFKIVEELTLIQTDKKTDEELKEVTKKIKKSLTNIIPKVRYVAERIDYRKRYQKKLWEKDLSESTLEAMEV